MSTPSTHPRRCLMFVPGSRPERYAKAIATGADQVCIDLEDAVAPGDKESAFTALKCWMDAMPTGIEGRRQMPNFGLTDAEYQNLADFLLWVNTIKAQDWPPNDAG